MHSPLPGGNFCHDHGKALKLATIQIYISQTHRICGKNLTACETFNLLADGLGNGQRSCSSIFWTLPFSTALSFSPLVVSK